MFLLLMQLHYYLKYIDTKLIFSLSLAFFLLFIQNYNYKKKCKRDHHIITAINKSLPFKYTLNQILLS